MTEDNNKMENLNKKNEKGNGIGKGLYIDIGIEIDNNQIILTEMEDILDINKDEDIFNELKMNKDNDNLTKFSFRNFNSNNNNINNNKYREKSLNFIKEKTKIEKYASKNSRLKKMISIKDNNKNDNINSILNNNMNEKNNNKNINKNISNYNNNNLNKNSFYKSTMNLDSLNSNSFNKDNMNSSCFYTLTNTDSLNNSKRKKI